MFQEKITSFFYLKVFALIFIVLVVGSIIFKVADEIINSSFRYNSYSLLIVSGDTKYISVDRQGKSATFLALGDIRSFVKGKKPIEASFALGIPINAIIVDNYPPQNLSDFSSAKKIWRLVWGQGVAFKNINKFDLFKLSNAINTAIKDNRAEVRLNIFNQKEVKEKIGDKLSDSSVINVAYTVEIDNGTNINGLGNLMAGILSRRGYNVISVKTSTESGNSFIAYPDKKNAYVESLSALTQFPIVKEKKSQAADITIFLGDDLDAMLSP